MTSSQFNQPILADLLTQIIGQKIHPSHINHKLILTTTLVTSLIGVIYADNKVDELEKQNLKLILDEFIPSSSNMSKLIKVILIGVDKQKVYLRKDAIASMAICLEIPEKLLIISLCYQMANSDGEVDKREENYIQALSKIFHINPDYLLFLSSNCNSQEYDQDIKSEVYSLLDPHNFQHLDPAFAQAAALLRNKIVCTSKQLSHASKIKISYSQLAEFKEVYGNLVQIILNISELVQQAIQQEILSSLLEDEVNHILEKATSRNFRVAVAGEFSQGKSTLLNALIGEEVQPTRAVPCSGTITILRYGEQHKVICRFKDNHEEEVSFEDYQKLSSISEEAALSNISEELANSEIREIIFEHPQLELCKNQVEIIDSPGLNEHPNRSEITLQLLDNVDAVIFIANASRLFTESERNLLISIKEQMQSSDLNKPADNIFVVVNFMDLLRNESNKQQVKQRAHNFLYEGSPLISGQNKLHFISAQAALDGILYGTDNEYLEDFKQFTKSLETFLAQERGTVVINQVRGKLENLIEKTLADLKQSLNILEGKINISQAAKIQIIEHIGDASGLEFKLRLMYDSILDESLDLVSDSWGHWLEGITDRIADKSANWTSQADDKSAILRDFSNQFVNDLSLDLNHWLEQTVKHTILVSKIEEFDEFSHEALEAINENLKSVDLISGANLSEKFNWSLKNFGVDLGFSSRLDPSSIKDDDSFLDSLLIGGGGLLGGVLAFLGVGLLPLLLGGFTAGAVINWLFGSSPEEIVLQMKQEVYYKGFEKFFESTEEIGKKIGEGVVQALRLRYESSSKAIEYSISILNEVLHDQEKSHLETIESNLQKKEFIRLRMTELYKLESRLRGLSNSQVNS